MKGLLSVAFGTSYEQTRVKTIDAVEASLRAEFPDFAFYSAWSSGSIVSKVKAERGEHHDTLDEAFARLSADGVDDLIVSTMFLMHGGEMAKVVRAVESWMAPGARSAHIAEPLLSSAADRQTVARVICDEFASVPESDALLLMGHGSSQGANEVYDGVQSELHALGRTRFFVATVEGTPTFEDAWELIAKSGASCVHLAPLMIVAGDHAVNDMAGGDDSWASRIEAGGFRTEVVMRGLGECEGIRRLVCDHAHDAAVVREVDLRG